MTDTEELQDTNKIHDRHLERARRIDQAFCDTIMSSDREADNRLALAVAFQAAADLLHEEADAAAEARKRGHQSLTKDLRNTAGRIVGIAQDLLELSKLDAPVQPERGYPPLSDAEMEREVPNFNLSPLTEAERAEPYTAATDPALSQDDVAAYLRGVTDEIEQAAIDAGNEIGSPMVEVFPERIDVQALIFMDPTPFQAAVGAPPGVDVEMHKYEYADLSAPVSAHRVPDHWSWSQLTTLEDCGVQYRGQRLENIPQVPQWANVGGHAFHAVTERFDRGAWQMGGADILPEVHPELLKERWLEAFAAAIQETEQATGIAPGPQADVWRASNRGLEGYTWWLVEGEQMLARYVKLRRKLDHAARDAGTLAVPLELDSRDDAAKTYGVKPVIEWEYVRTVAGPLGDLKVHGVIDRAYRLIDGSIMVKDLKSGRGRPNGGQLGEYAWAIVDAIGAGPSGTPTILGSFYDARKGIFSDPIDLLTTHPREEYVMRYHAAEHTRRGGIFMPRRSDFCNGCSIRWACPVGSAS